MVAVDLAKRTCSCKKWDLSGIPCSHAVSAIWHRGQEPEDYVSHWYNKKTFMRTYAHKIFSIRDQEEWPKSAKTPMIKPDYKTQPGRPKKLRQLEHDEVLPPKGTKMRRVYVQLKCGLCGKQGHNARTCNRRSKSNNVS